MFVLPVSLFGEPITRTAGDLFSALAACIAEPLGLSRLQAVLGSHNPGLRSPHCSCGLSQNASPRHCGGEIALLIAEFRLRIAELSDLSNKRDRLLDLIRSFESCAVAFSAGVDSTVVAKAAFLTLGENAVAVTGTSASLASGELAEAKQLAELIGIRHIVMQTEEFSNDDYMRNARDRCYHCKTELYTKLDERIDELGVRVILNGANVDDLGDYRPGMQAATEHQVYSPLADCNFTKADVRALAAEWNLPVSEKPATPCLSSRVAYGEEVTPARLQMIDQAERFLRDHGLTNVRVRYHKGDLARLEVPIDALAKLCSDGLRESLVARLHEIGFQFITLDLEGFRSGSLNTLIDADRLYSKYTAEDAE